MSQLETHLLDENPSIVLIGNNTIFQNLVILMLKKQNLQVININPDELLHGEVNLQIFNNAYKIIWLYEHDNNKSDNYVNILSFLKEVTTPIIVITNLIASLADSNNGFFEKWQIRSKEQLQFIVDCTFYLPKASFIFGQDVIINGVENTSLEFITQKIHKGIIIDPGVELSFIEANIFIESLKEYLFRSGKQSSVLIKGDKSDKQSVIALLKKLYDSYHKVNMEIVFDHTKLIDSVPFSVEEKIMKSDLRAISTKIVKDLPPPGEIKQELPVEKPSEKDFIKNKILRKIEAPVVTKKAIIEKNINSQSKTLDVAEKKENIKRKNEINQVDIGDEIQRIFKTSRTDVRVNRVRKIAKSTKKITKKSKRRTFLFIGGIGVIGASIGIILLILIFFISQSVLKKELISSISSGVIEQNTSLIEDGNLKKITNFVGLQVDSYGLIIESNLISQSALVVSISKSIQSMPQILLQADEASKNLALQVLTGDIGNTSELAQILNDKAQLAYEKLSNIQASLEQVEFNMNSNTLNSIISDYEDKIKKIRAEMVVQQQLQPIMSSLTGETTKKTYAVIMQNNQELRPTGGFIQAVALLNFDEGSLVSYKVYNVYDLDKKLFGEIVPPDDLKKYLGEEKWYLRDSNWNPDFPDTSKQIGWFLSKSLGIDIDGVIAVNLFTFKDILEAIGPVDLPEYNEIITHKNILERMEFHSEVILVDSPESIDYSVTLFEKIIDKIINVDREKIPSLLSSLKKSLENNQTLFSVLEESDQVVLHNLGWTGGLIKPQCPARLSVVDCDVDVLAQVEANVGINKANYYLDRSIIHKIKIDRKKAFHRRQITFKNNAKSNSWPKGTYKSYQRFYLDKNAEIDHVLINGSALIEEQISKKIIKNFMEIGIRVDVPIQKQVVVDLVYSTPHNSNGGFSYVFFNQKQPGTTGDSLRIEFEYSDDLRPVLIAPAADVYEKTINFDTGKNNSLFGVEFE